MASKRWLVSSAIIVEAENQDIARRTITEFVQQSQFVHTIQFHGNPLLMKEDEDDSDSLEEDEKSSEVFSLRHYWELKDTMKREAENASYRAVVEHHDEDSINPNEADMGTTRRD